MRSWARWAPLGGIAFVALWLIGFGILDNDVESGDSDAKILSYYAKSSNQDTHIIFFLMTLAAALLFIWFIVHLRGRLERAEGGPGNLTAGAFVAGMAANVFWLLASAIFAAPSFTLDDTKKFTLDPDTFRLLSDLGYAVWFSGTTLALVTVLCTAILSLRTGLLPKWITWLSFPVAATMLVSFFFIPFLIMCGWILVVCLTFLWPERKTAPAAMD